MASEVLFILLLLVLFYHWKAVLEEAGVSVCQVILKRRTAHIKSGLTECRLI